MPGQWRGRNHQGAFAAATPESIHDPNENQTAGDEGPLSAAAPGPGGRRGNCPTVNSADQITVQPASQPSSASGIFSRVAAASASEMPASSRMRRQPGPKGRTFW